MTSMNVEKQRLDFPMRLSLETKGGNYSFVKELDKMVRTFPRATNSP
jgi:hypothetical protein